MNKIIKTLGLALVAGLTLASCSEEKFDGVNQNGQPNIQDVDYTVSVDQNTNIVTFTLNTPGYYPIWEIEGSPEYKGTTNGLRKHYIFKGNYKYTLKVGNRNGISDGIIEGSFDVDTTRYDFSKTIAALTDDGSKEWRIFASKKAHIACGQPGGDGTDWWAAGPNEKADQGIYDDRVVFTNTNDYKYDAGEDGNTFINAGVTSFDVAAGGDYSIPLVGNFGMQAEAKYALGYDDATDTETITLPAHTLFPYIANQDQIDKDYTFRILSIDSKYMELALDREGIVWHFTFINGDDPAPTTDFDPDMVNWADAASDLNLARKLNEVGTMVFWWADGNWTQQADPTFSYADGIYSITAPYATVQQWQAQCSIHNGNVAVEAGKPYDIQVTLVASEAFGNATVKICEDVEGDKPELLNENPVSLKKGENVLRYAKRYPQSDGTDASGANLKFILDLGGCPAGLNVQVKDIIIQAHNPK
jgi:hypothetical protein